MVDAAGTQSRLSGGESPALFADPVGDRYPDIVEHHFRVAVLIGVSEDRVVADHSDSGGVARYQDHGLLPVRGAVESLFPMRTKKAPRGSMAPLVHHFRPLTR